MKKTIGIVVILVAMLIILTGCSVNIDYQVKVNANGTGEISYIYGYSKDTLESLQTTSADLVKSMKEQAEENGYTTEEYKDDNMEGFKATKVLKDISKEFSFTEAFGDENVEDKEGQEIIIDRELFTIKVKQDAEIDLTSVEDVKSAVNIKYTVKLPVNVKSSNAKEVSKDKKTATWELTPGEVNKIEFVASGLNVASTLSIVFLVAVFAAGIVYFVLFFKKKKETNE